MRMRALGDLSDRNYMPKTPEYLGLRPLDPITGSKAQVRSQSLMFFFLGGGTYIIDRGKKKGSKKVQPISEIFWGLPVATCLLRRAPECLSDHYKMPQIPEFQGAQHPGPHAN